MWFQVTEMWRPSRTGAVEVANFHVVAGAVGAVLHVHGAEPEPHGVPVRAQDVVAAVHVGLVVAVQHVQGASPTAERPAAGGCRATASAVVSAGRRVNLKRILVPYILRQIPTLI